MDRYQDATQARCPECNHNLADWATPHVAGCHWQQRQIEMARNVANDPAYQNSYGYGNQQVATPDECDADQSSQGPRECARQI